MLAEKNMLNLGECLTTLQFLSDSNAATFATVVDIGTHKFVIFTSLVLFFPRQIPSTVTEFSQKTFIIRPSNVQFWGDVSKVGHPKGSPPCLKKNAGGMIQITPML